MAGLEQQLLEAQERLNRAMKALAPVHKGGEREEYQGARGALLTAERELAKAKGEEYAVPADFPVQWDVGAPLPVVIANDYSAFLAFYIRFYDPKWDGTYITLRDPVNANADPMALVEFEGCVSAKLGAPNEEVFSGHPLYGRGLEAYSAQLVHNSRWIKELENINRVHRMYNADHWRGLKHFVFWFHDSTFECIAENYKVEVLQEPLVQILSRVYERMV